MQDTSVSLLKSIDNDNTRVPGGLVYKHPSQAEYPTHAGHWTKALETILQCCEREEESANNPIVFFGNEKVSSRFVSPAYCPNSSTTPTPTRIVRLHIRQVPEGAVSCPGDAKASKTTTRRAAEAHQNSQ